MRAEAHKNGRKSRWGVRLTTALSVLVLGASGVGHLMASELNADVNRVDPFQGLTDRPRDTGGVNFLVVGTDRRDKLSDEQRQKYRLGGSACDCTDTLMLVHISADHDRASVVSLPRDSYTKLPAHTDAGTGKRHAATPAKLNSAYAHGGAHLTVNTVEAMTDIHIDHYMEVDFTSFMRTVDVLGGVPVCTEKPLHDSYSGLDLPAGTTELDGGRALQYVRARHLGDGSDLGRMERQQHFLAAVIEKATDSGVLMNPVKLRKVASTVLDSVRADSGLGTEQMLELGRALRRFDSSSSEFVSVPVENADYKVPKLGSTVKWDEPKARKLFAALRDDKPLTPQKPKDTERAGGSRGGKAGSGDAAPGTAVSIPPAGIQVHVENGTRHEGLARSVDKELRATGFDTTGDPASAERRNVSRTSITYDPRWDRSARTLAKALPGAELVEEAGRGPVMRVTVGKKHHSVRKVHLSPHSSQGPAPSTGARNDGALTGGERASCA
ncbi:LCP family protein [Streptomyces sp. WMMB 322]|uniref:LCP family protein n=1 Tax=Streptomyces sp. WMMB 322 TaxID=1286821 RepID=UPI0008238F1C|nr:LCP family protein [Streptomyces sp. WMMB 322]SCK11182.1 transcriptional attenuator, LytR family [Streptomyces sp. WMMB 322]